MPESITSNQKTDRQYCSFARRVLAILYDGVILIGVLIFASAVALPFGNVNKVAFQDFWFTVWLFLAGFAYFGACWRYGAMTVGMRAWKILLISSDEKPVSWPRCLIRYVVALLSLSLFGIGFFWALGDSKSRAWHDLASKSLLIHNK